jgi:hypothetical protein
MWEIEKTVSKGDYNYCVVRDHPKSTKNDYVLEHRVVVENSIGRMLKENEVVHHINEDKKDNRLENLQIMTRSEHASHHAPKGRAMVKLICPECELQFERERRQTHIVKPKQKRTFCCRSCSAKYYSKH